MGGGSTARFASVSGSLSANRWCCGRKSSTGDWPGSEFGRWRQVLPRTRSSFVDELADHFEVVQGLSDVNEPGGLGIGYR